MNIIIYGFDSSYNLSLLKNIFNIDFLENIFVICDGKENFALKKVNIRFFNIYAISLGDYPDLPGLEPLDQVIISEFAECESFCMKMFDRLEFWFKLSYEERRNLYLRHLRFWYFIIEKYNITTYIGPTPHEIFDFIIYSIIKKRNGKILFFTQSQFLNRVFFSNDAFSYFFPAKKESYEHINDEIMDYYKSMKQLGNKFKKPFYMSDISKRGKYKPFSFIRKYNKLAENPVLKQKYIYFPLHYQPESTTSPLAKEYVKQELIVQLLDYYLPKDIAIYIKEHPKQMEVGRNKITYNSVLILSKITRRLITLILKTIISRTKISEIKKEIFSYGSSLFSKHNSLLSTYNIESENSRITFIKTTFDSQELIANSMAVVTCTGTAAAEALIKEKPVLIFGNYIFDYAPGVKKIVTKQDMNDAYNFINNFSFNENELLNYFQMLYDNSHHLVIDKGYLDEVKIDIETNNEILFKIIKTFLYNIMGMI